MSATRNEAFKDIQDSLPGRQQAVLNTIAMLSGGATLFELCNTLGLPVNSVSGRVTELHKAKRVYDSGLRRVNPLSNKKAIVWYAYVADRY